MKKSILALLSLFITAETLLALDVSTEPQHKKALLEEFTGVNCSYCPEGHAMAAKLNLAQPENVYIMSVHAGPFATPYQNDPNFLTEEGTTLNDYFGANSYPSGMVNRSKFEYESPILSRGFWNQCARRICQEISPVNLAIECDYDKSNNQYTVTVAGYYTATPDCETSNLCVALVQNNIIGYQAGSNQLYNYVHQHVLRDYFTPVWGDPIDNITQGSRFEKTYKMTLPEIIGNTQVIPAQLEVIAFVTAGKGGEVLNVTSGRADPSMFNLPLEAEISAYKIPVGQNYGYNFLELYVENKGSVAISDATFNVSLNGVTTEAKWSGEIPPMTKQAISINVDWQSTQIDNNSYSIQLTALNGKEYEGNSFSGTFGAIIPVPTSVIVNLQADHFINDNSFCLKDDQGNIIQSFGPYEDDSQIEYIESVTFEKDKIYCLEIIDSWGNSMSSLSSYLNLYDTNQVLLAQSPNIVDHGIRLFVKASIYDHEIPATPEVLVKNITHISALVQWRGQQTAYEVAFGKTGEEPTVKVIEGVAEDSNYLELTDLTAETAYEVKVRGIAGENDYSNWSETVTFTTAAWPECQKPTNLQANLDKFVDEGIVELSWDGNEEHTSWEVRYRESSSTSYAYITDIMETKTTISGLNHSTAYLWSVRAECIADRTTAWSSQSSFETPEIDGICSVAVADDLSVTAANGYVSVINGKVYVKNVVIFDANGRLITSVDVEGYDNAIIPINIPGIAVVMVNTTDKTFSYKVVIK